MTPIRKFDEITDHLKNKQVKKTVAVAYAHDPNTIEAIAEAIKLGLIEAFMIGDTEKIKQVAHENKISENLFKIIHVPDQQDAIKTAVEMVRNDEADILMKGLVNTDKFLKAVLDKRNGLMRPNAVMSFVGALEIPKYHKLLFLTDPAVIPYPNLDQKIAMIKYAIEMVNKFGIEKPKISLIEASEKINPHLEHSVNTGKIVELYKKGEFSNCIIDGPLDLFLSCDKKSVEIKGVPTPIDGDADILVFPSIEAANIFYKSVMLFGNGELAGLIQGTTKPVMVMSRSESPKSKFYCLALACLMA